MRGIVTSECVNRGNSDVTMASVFPRPGPATSRMTAMTTQMNYLSTQNVVSTSLFSVSIKTTHINYLSTQNVVGTSLFSVSNKTTQMFLMASTEFTCNNIINYNINLFAEIT